MIPNRYPYQTIPPDVWAECLSHLPPAELSMASELLPLTTPTNVVKSTDRDADAEQAAWLAVRAMVEIAENHWEAEETAAEAEKEVADEERNTDDSGTGPKRDNRALELQTLVSRDTTITGDLLRRSSGYHRNRGASPASARGGRHNNRPATPRRRPFFRFLDETWQSLYGILYKILSESELDPVDFFAESTSLEPHNDPRARDDHSNADNEDEDDDHGGNGNGYGNGGDTARENQRSLIGVHNKEGIALAVGLVFGVPPLPATLMTPPRRRMLTQIARACSACCHRDGNGDGLHNSKGINHCETQNQTQPQTGCFLLSNARCYLLSLRLADEGLWDIASYVLQSRSLLAAADEHKPTADIAATNSSELLLSIDGMIYVSTFLIDRLYSQTYVRDGKDDLELAIAVRLGRKAVGMAEIRYRAFVASQTNSAATAMGARTQTKPQSCATATNMPPPPMESLFASNALRCIHAKLALGKALALLAQHTGLRASDTKSLREHGVEPLKDQPPPPALINPTIQAEDEELWRRTEFFPEIQEQILWAQSFFEESRRQLQDGLAVGEKELLGLGAKISGSSGNGSALVTDAAVVSLLGALRSAEAEGAYCAGSVAGAMGQRAKMKYYVELSILGFLEAFAALMKGMLALASHGGDDCDYDYYDDYSGSNGGSGSAETTLDVLLRCGKDLGKVYGFADKIGLKSGNGRPGLAQMFLDWAHLVSIYRHGSFHPTTENIERLSERQRGGGYGPGTTTTNSNSLAQKYLTVVTSLAAQYVGSAATMERDLPR